MRKTLAWILCLLCLITATGCGQKPAQETPQTTQLPAETVPAPVQTAPVQTVPVETAPRYDVVVSTVYGDICYHEQWAEHMRVDLREENGFMNVCFLAEFNGIKYPLFDLIIGVSEEESVAMLTGPDGVARGVGVNFIELGEYPELAEDQQNQLYAMQEDINFVIASIQ